MGDGWRFELRLVVFIILGRVFFQFRRRLFGRRRRLGAMVGKRIQGAYGAYRAYGAYGFVPMLALVVAC